ncbi:hypothetical protein [Kiloniella majae]|uniref:hypothetical protein n=1 Tax=Kiloniella majae TaxID=1938558 RepID=UPI000A2786E3|nr:hypothetical protein [Kiloniella majae]
MQGEIDQLLVLSSAVNAIAQKEPLRLPAAQAKRLRHTEDLAFVDLCKKNDGTVKEPIRFTKLSHWLEDLCNRKISAAWLVWQPQHKSTPSEQTTETYIQPEHMKVAFAGATKSWSLIATGPDFTEHWQSSWGQASWGLQDDREKQQNIWQVRYDCIQKTDQETPRPTIDMAQEIARLDEVLRAMTTLAGQLGHGNWSAVFNKAIDALEGKRGTALPPAIRPPYYAAYPKDAHRLLAAIYNGWVFGGMGSWNDVVFPTPEDQAEYDRLTPELYQSLCRAIVAVSCSFQRP